MWIPYLLLFLANSSLSGVIITIFPKAKLCKRILCYDLICSGRSLDIIWGLLAGSDDLGSEWSVVEWEWVGRDRSIIYSRPKGIAVWESFPTASSKDPENKTQDRRATGTSELTKSSCYHDQQLSRGEYIWLMSLETFPKFHPNSGLTFKWV